MDTCRPRAFCRLLARKLQGDHDGGRVINVARTNVKQPLRLEHAKTDVACENLFGRRVLGELQCVQHHLHVVDVCDVHARTKHTLADTHTDVFGARTTTEC